MTTFFPDVNVWLALMMEDHVHRQSVDRNDYI